MNRDKAICRQTEQETIGLVIRTGIERWGGKQRRKERQGLGTEHRGRERKGTWNRTKGLRNKGSDL